MFDIRVIVYAVVVGVSFAAGAWASGTIVAARAQRELIGQQIKWQNQIDEANVRAYSSAQSYEAAKRRLRPQIIEVEREVKSVIEKSPDWASAPLPDGMRDALASAVAKANSAVAD